MTLRPHIAFDPSRLVEVRPVAKIARVCELLDCEESQVRRLLDDGELEGHGLGTRGVRVYLDSVQAYQERHTRPSTGKAAQRGPRRPKRTQAGLAAHRAAMATLQRLGIKTP